MNTPEQPSDQERPDSAEPESADTDAAANEDDVRRRFREALEQKPGSKGRQKAPNAGPKGSAVGERQGPTGRRTFRRKSG